jgi:rhodanese-related sulfurtransferase
MDLVLTRVREIDGSHSQRPARCPLQSKEGEVASPVVKVVSVDEVLAKREADPQLLLLDVRSEPEWEIHHIPGATLVPMAGLVQRLHELDRNRETIVVCEHGVRSYNVALYLASEAGFTNVATMEGGMSEWNGPREQGG